MTRRSLRISLKQFPGLKHVLIQVLFWVVVNSLLSVLIYLLLKSIGHTFSIPFQDNISAVLFLGITRGLVYGSVFGSIEYTLHKYWFTTMPVGKSVVIQVLISVALILGIWFLLRYYIFNSFIAPSIIGSGMQLTVTSWEYLFAFFLLFHSFASVWINLITQINRKISIRALLPLLFDKYRIPKEEERIFMFMDLTASTTIAEQLGHQRYSAFIKDCFIEINTVLLGYNAEVYQYVGDEIVISWQATTQEKLDCVKFFFSCEKQFEERNAYYQQKYGTVPVFKAGAHGGKVTVVEVGTTKHEIAFHGDTLNTASRIQGLCNVLGRRLLVSESLLDNDAMQNQFDIEMLGEHVLRGKTKPVKIAGIAMR